jgi:hypothetical protein
LNALEVKMPDLYADPLRMAKEFWPDITFYKQQKEIIYSVVENRETVIVAANKLGKDYVAGFLILWFFLTRHPCRVVTTSAKDDHLRVLWGEMGNYISTCKYSLIYDPKSSGANRHTGLVVNQREIRRVVQGQVEELSYIKGMVASADTIASMQGHHVTPFPRTIEAKLQLPLSMFVCDEASSVPDGYYTMADTWMHRALIFGNAWPCSNFFKRAVKGNPKTSDRGGDLEWA